MAGCFSVSRGLNPQRKLVPGAAQVLFIGRKSVLKNVPKLSDVIGQKLSEQPAVKGNEEISKLLERLSITESMQFCQEMAKISLVPDVVSRYNSAANNYAIFREVKGTRVQKGVKQLDIVLFVDYANAMASAAAVARAFPLFSCKSKPENELESVELELVVTGEKQLSDADMTFLRSLCTNIRQCARLVDTPTNMLHSEAFLDEANAMVDSTGQGNNITKTILKGKELQERGFGGIYSVGQAATHPPIFACYSYQPEGASKNIALVGKGIVYDTGGLSLKGKTQMPTMKIDMGGAAALLGAFCTLVSANFKQNLHLLLCIAENQISPEATRPDDIIKLLSGKTVEVNNTDAEGRLVLADGVFYAKQTLKAQTIIDMATLTGAQLIATGKHSAAVVSNNERLENECVLAGRKSGDLTHPLPYLPELHFADLASRVADMKNSNLGTHSGPSSAVAGLFIGAQIIDYAKPQDSDPEWLHVDIAACAAGKAWDERATGFGTALVSSLLAEHTDAEVAKF